MKTTVSDWLEGARLRTLPAAAAPVLAGAGLAYAGEGFSFPRVALALAVALLLQIGVNFSNDYSDGVRGTDDFRTGPPRLTGGGKVSAKVVLAVALGCFAAAAVLGLLLVALTGRWWLLGLGLAAIVAAWFYTGGKHPYGYMGIAEIFVFVFFGLMATVGTVYVCLLSAPFGSWLVGAGMGLYSCALLMVNNIRDIPTDRQAGKKTLAVRLGEARARRTYVGYLVLAPVCIGVGLAGHVLAIVAAVVLEVCGLISCLPVVRGARGHSLLQVLTRTGQLTLAAGVVTLLVALL
ncbi:MAG: 1,4-dihydroxy-2-naphthoate polyprenyltransferase [Winkia neuii]|uniref:1,4-dihydroxy-2-naphthoate octaprenyltransferase n=1 Tax=Winkia neuii TaxID=33007 RepID=A0A2I1ILL9_9ACTO|nr:1,4-dihydroxy-2-naphthoate polyprenyltransferase [Winkia neuii]OFJ70866.1 1,4-dihydroxy-2-naphthoate octaprenyltransferase [Actinomyces sp. HMSC064C12]OFK02599.1 1,4-dihydroxy-2-naphthoate octaprenyltransferase [Actinomyces sp. HMSC072A03]OFT54174.1 1,4-dihydroxy-2-naphthoate octaprenyltransferase [Actinomyces sp. HMSC06A08]KWZ74799.1 1,4-dihydroxy-2-naphthoate octaprenyltransferase [Winkia neuii]MDK8099357.1 1,4-dihydroxy-2-naphthoate polyprenyltransferase [Winkia neuii]